MSTAPNALAEAGKGGLSPSHPSPNACFSCRLVSGGGLIGAAAYVFAMSQKSTWASTARGTIGKMAQLTFATGLAAWGIFVIVGNDEKTKKDRGLKTV